MDSAKKIKLPSGAELHLMAAPFADSKALYQAMLKELNSLELDPKENIDVNFFKNIFCVGFSSKEIEACLWKCFERCLINKTKITEDYFEPVAARDDYFAVCFEVAKENVMPFTRSLYAQYAHILGQLKIPSDPA